MEQQNITTDKLYEQENKVQEKYILRISSNSIDASDDRFSIDNLELGDMFTILDVYFKRSDGEIIRRKRNNGERKVSNQTMALIACQLYEDRLSKLSYEEKENFPVCKYSSKSELIKGIYTSVEEFKKRRNTLEYLTYTYDEGKMFVLYCWNIFSTIMFVQECLRRFGSQGDQFVLTYRDKIRSEIKNDEIEEKELIKESKDYLNEYSHLLIESKNIIFRGAPGTGKSYLAKEIAADIISGGRVTKFSDLTSEQKQQVEFVQFHPNYDYSDFVEGLRPKINSDGSIGFELQDGIFKKFISKARKNYVNSYKSNEEIKEESVKENIKDFFSSIELGVDTFKTVTGNEFKITNIDDNHISIFIPNNPSANKLMLNTDELRLMLESDKIFSKVNEMPVFFGRKYAMQENSYIFSLYQEIKKKKIKNSNYRRNEDTLKKKYIFIIDEINRGEISKIFGELFYSIDPGNRGIDGEISTQYSNMHSDPNEKFYIPNNVYIIGTMNDIDRSVDSFDFAMRRRFRFIEIKAEDSLEMLSELKNDEIRNEAISRMEKLNKEIVQVEDLNENYQIGASYFLKLENLTFDQLWTDCLKPLLQEYIQGLYNESEIMKKFEQAYGYKEPSIGA